MDKKDLPPLMMNPSASTDPSVLVVIEPARGKRNLGRGKMSWYIIDNFTCRGDVACKFGIICYQCYLGDTCSYNILPEGCHGLGVLQDFSLKHELYIMNILTAPSTYIPRPDFHNKIEL